MKRLTTLLLTTILALPAAANAADDLIIVLDASNSMWAKINDTHKIVFARDALSQLLTAQPDTASIGLISYGNRHKRDCQDINTLAKPGDSTPSALLKQAREIMPHGGSPISGALRQAATQGNTILLISDGTESCDNDPCATTQELKSKNPNLRIHVMGFNDAADSPLRCIAERSGGSFTLATDKTAISNGLSKLTQSTGTSTPTPSTAADSTISKDPGTLELSIGGSNDPENLPANFLIYDAAGQHLVTFTSKTTVSRPLQPGTYRIDALWGEIKKTQTLEVTAGKTVTHRFDLGALGVLTFNAVDTQQKPVDANFSLYNDTNGYYASALLKNQVTEKLPVGTYKLKATINEQVQQAELTITADKETRHTFTFQPQP